MRHFFSFSNLAAGFVAMLVGFTSSGAIVFQAASAAGATPAEIGSWLFALGLSLATTCIGLSLYYRMPILTGWSTPGAALLVTSLSSVSMGEAIGAFIFAALLTFLTGATKLFERMTAHIPSELTSAMLAGILFHFGLNVFVSLPNQPLLITTMLITYLFGKRFFPKYVIIFILLVGITMASAEGLFHIDTMHFELASPILIKPIFSLSALISIGVPLYIVTMTSQYMPGITILRNAGYPVPVSPIITWTGLTNLIFAPFGCYAISLAAITAAICSGKEADNNPNHRYKATIFAGLCWLFTGFFGATVVALFFALPKELTFAVAGLSIFATIGTSFKAALQNAKHQEPAVITILVSASGISLFGIGSACWGLIAGIIASTLLGWHKKEDIGISEPRIS